MIFLLFLNPIVVDTFCGHTTLNPRPPANSEGIGMGNIINFAQHETTDFASAVDEVDILVPKYLEALDLLECQEKIEAIEPKLKNVVAYWERLTRLFVELKPLEPDMPFDQITRDCLQAELVVLEKVYLRINLRIDFHPETMRDIDWDVAEKLLERMDWVLKKMGFRVKQKDRFFLRTVKQKNLAKRREAIEKEKH